MKNWILVATVVALLTGLSVTAQDSATTAAPVPAAAPAEETEDAVAEEEPKGPPPLAMSTSKVYANGALYATVAKVNTGKEFIGLTVPAKYWFRAAENGREITVYTDAERRNAVIFRFHTNSFPEFVHGTVWPLVRDHFDGVTPVMSQGSTLGRNALVFTAKAGTTSNPKQIRSMVVPCQAGSISVTAESYGEETDHAFFFMKQLTASLQSETSEKEISGSVPTLTD